MTGLAQPISLSPRDNVGGVPPDTELQSEGAFASAELVDAHGNGEPAPNKVIGVLSYGTATALAVYRDEIKTAIERGLAQRPDAVWVCLESDRMSRGIFDSVGVTPVALPLNDYWRVHGTAQDGTEVRYDDRRNMAELELMGLCDELVVFHVRKSPSQWRERLKKKLEYGGQIHRSLFVVELGPEPKKKQTKGRKPTGA